MADRNKLTLDDLGLLLEELMGVRNQWYRLGLQLKVRPEALDTIRVQFSDPRDQLLEVLKTWLTTSDNPSWKTLTDALRRQSVGQPSLADDLVSKYKVEETEKAKMSASRESQKKPLSLQEETQMRNKLTLDDLGLLLEKLMDVCDQWNGLGLNLHLGVETMDRIRELIPNVTDKLLEVLKTWLTTSDNPSWKTISDALRSPRVRANRLAGGLESKYCLTKDMRKRTMDDHSLLLEELDYAFQLDELVNVHERWYPLGLQLKVNTKILDRIRAQFSDSRDQLQEMLKTWLTISDNPSWKTVTDALRRQSVSGYQIADYLESKYCSMKDMSETVPSPPGITDLSQDDSTLLEPALSETQQLPLSPQEETQMRNKLTVNDLHLLLEELLDMHVRWYNLGVQLNLRPETLEAIRAHFKDPRDQLREMLKIWLTTSDNPSWKILTDALKSPAMGESQLAGGLETKYCQMEGMLETVPSPPGISDLSQDDSTPLGNKLTLDDLRLLLEELLDVCDRWYNLGLELNLKSETLSRIHDHARFPDSRDQLLEMLKTWLTTSDNASWKTVTDALRSKSVRAPQLAGGLERKYCLTKDMRERNILALDDLDILLEELIAVRDRWYNLGLQLKVRPGTLDRIRVQFSDSRGRLLEMLKAWLTTIDNASWKALTDALKSQSVGGYQIADYLENKYCPMKDMRETVQSPPGIIDPSQDDSTPLEVQMSASREAQLTPTSLQEVTHMSENPAIPISLKQILKDTKEVTNWYSLGIHLDITTSVLKRIIYVDPERCKIEVIEVWLHHDPEATWNKLAQAVEDMGGHPKVVETLRANHEGVPLISTVPVTTQDEDKSGPPSISDYPSPPPTLQAAVIQGDTSSSHHLPHPEAVVQLEFGYRKAQLIKTARLGTGSYGAVYKAMCDDLPCAGKILHSIFFQSDDPGAMTIMKQFQQECSVLSAIRHPNIVQYLGSYQDPETRLPVLLMELMDNSLTQFLEHSEESLPYHTQVDICHDIALALAYLHSNDIIHRDLSSNNVLLIGAGNRAKVTDFGMAKLFDVNCSTMTPLTMCPGTQPYMSPEALDDPPVYTKKLDSFSFGVLGIQIITRQLPKPSPRTKKVQDPRDPKRRLHEVVPDIERRKSHLDLINPTHPLLSIATHCLSEEDRPSAQELCCHLALLKKAPQYGESVQQAQERSRAVHRERQIKELQREEEFHEQIRVLQQQLHVSYGQVQEKDRVLTVRQLEYEAVTQEKDCIIEAKETQLQELNQQLAASEQVTAQLQQKIQELQEENQQKIEKFPLVRQKGSIHGVEVAGEAEFTVSTEGGSFQWKGYGLRLHVPKDSLPAGTGECRINIRVSLSGQFQLPEGSDFLSPVYWISAPCKFTKPVTLEIQHCSLTEDEAVLSNLGFVFTKCSQSDLPYIFKLLEGGVFTKHSNYGNIQLKNFSGFSVFGRKGTPRSYCAHLYRTMKPAYEWRFYFVITQDLEAKNTHVRKCYSHFTQEATLRVAFEHSEITLVIPDGLVTEGWRITPFTTATITKEDVDQFKEGQWIPECQLVVQWEKEDKRPVRLMHKVDLTGAKAPHNFIHLILNPAGEVPHPVKLHSTPELGDLMNFVAAEIPGKWREVGIGLGLDTTDISRIEADVPTHKSTPCYLAVFYTWKNKGTKEYTWDTLLKTLRTPSVDASKLASTIKDQLS